MTKSKFDLPAFFDVEYYKSRYEDYMSRGNTVMASIWETFYFDNAVSFAFCSVYRTEIAKDRFNPKHQSKAMQFADEYAKALRKEYA